MQDSGFLCKQHQQKISFVCTANQWHFKPLCSECVPEHTQKHPKNIKVHLESYDAVVKQGKQQKQKALQMYSGMEKQLNELIEVDQNLFRQYQEIEQACQKTMQTVKNWFQQLRVAFQKHREAVDHHQKQLLNKLQENIKDRLIQFNRLDDHIDQEWLESIKGVYKKGDLEVYRQQIEEVMVDYKSAVLDRTSEINLHQKIPQIVAKTLNTWKVENQQHFSGSRVQTKAPEEAVQEQEMPKQIRKGLDKDPKDKKVSKSQKYVAPKPKPLRKKRCEYCDEEMDYLTQLKKHLVCRYCGGKERNYTKK